MTATAIITFTPSAPLADTLPGQERILHIDFHAKTRNEMRHCLLKWLLRRIDDNQYHISLKTLFIID